MIKNNIHRADATDLNFIVFIYFFFKIKYAHAMSYCESLSDFFFLFENESLSDLILCNCLYTSSTSYLSKITF